MASRESCQASKASKTLRSRVCLSMGLEVDGRGSKGAGVPPRNGSAVKEFGVDVIKAAFEGTTDLEFVGSHIANKEGGGDVLLPGVVGVGSSFAGCDFFDPETAFSAEGFDVFFKASSETEGRVEDFGVVDCSEHDFGVLRKGRVPPSRYQ